MHKRKCITIDLLGNGIEDCPGGVDENNYHISFFCNTRFRRMCGDITNAKRKDVKCVSYSQIDDGVENCFNGYDELLETRVRYCSTDKNRYYCGEQGTRARKIIEKPYTIKSPHFKSKCFGSIDKCLLVVGEPKLVQDESIKNLKACNLTLLKTSNDIVNTSNVGMKNNTDYSKPNLNLILHINPKPNPDLPPLNVSILKALGIVGAGAFIAYLFCIGYIYLENDTNEPHGFRRLENALLIHGRFNALCKCSESRQQENTEQPAELVNTSENGDRGHDQADVDMLPPRYQSSWLLEGHNRNISTTKFTTKENTRVSNAIIQNSIASTENPPPYDAIHNSEYNNHGSQEICNL